MKIYVNGEGRELEDGATVRDAALSIGVEPGVRGMAIAVDGEVIPGATLAQVFLKDGQRVEIVKAIQGGAL